MDLPLLEEDFEYEGVIEPAQVVSKDVELPERGVLCFFGDIVAGVVAAGRHSARQLTTLSSVAGPTPVWEIDVSGQRLAVFQPGVGAPLAAGYLEEVIAMGCRRLVACGGSGALVPELVAGHAVVVDSALRDEGTSYHYVPPSRIIEADAAAVSAVVDALHRGGIAHVVGRTWTTDAFYRETRPRVERRVGEGCIVVEMEAAALLAVARYRQVAFGQLLLASDSLAGEVWDQRGWIGARAARERVFWAAADAALGI